MLWALLSVLASLCWALANVTDKFILSHWVKRPIVSLLALGMVSLLAAALVGLTHPIGALTPFQLLMAAVAGTAYITSSLFYFEAVKREEISRVVPLIYLYPLFVAGLAAVFLGEVFTTAKYVGVFLLVLGAVLVSNRDHLRIKSRKAAGFAVLSALASAVDVVALKYLLAYTDFWTAFFYGALGGLPLLLPLFALHGHKLARTLKTRGPKVALALGASETLNELGSLLFILATSTGYATLTSALGTVQPFFTLLLGIGLAKAFPGAIRENLDHGILRKKFLAICLVFAGVLLIT